MKALKRLFEEEDGSVEAGLTLIPLTILFLISAQLVFASHWGNAQQVDQQSQTNRIAISGKARDAASMIDDEMIRFEPLLGGGYLVISERDKPIPLLANFNGISGRKFSYQKQVPAVSEVFTE